MPAFGVDVWRVTSSLQARKAHSVAKENCHLMPVHRNGLVACCLLHSNRTSKHVNSTEAPRKTEVEGPHSGYIARTDEGEKAARKTG